MEEWMPIYLPKKVVPLAPSIDAPLFFLAGPINGGSDWQADMAEYLLRECPSAHIACPCRWDHTHRLAEFFHKPYTVAENRQLIWERHYLKQAGLENDARGCIVFWLPLESQLYPRRIAGPYAMDTRRELGKFTAFSELMRVRMVIGGDRRFHGLDAILYELSEAIAGPVIFHEDMVSAARAAVSIV